MINLPWQARIVIDTAMILTPCYFLLSKPQNYFCTLPQIS